MMLIDAKTGGKVLVTEIGVEHLIARRLEALGLNDGTVLTVMSKKYKGAMIVKVRGCRLALGKHITSMIEVEDWKEA